MPLFPFRVNISKLQEQDVMKKFTACTFPQDIIASSRWSAIHVHAHTHTQTHTLHRQRYQTLRCSPKHVRSLVWQKEEEWINQPAEKGRQTPLSSACTAGTTQFIPQDSWEIRIQLAQSGPSQKWSHSLTSSFTFPSKAPSSHHYFLTWRIQRALIVLHVKQQVCTSNCKTSPNSWWQWLSLMFLSHCYNFIFKLNMSGFKTVVGHDSMNCSWQTPSTWSYWDNALALPWKSFMAKHSSACSFIQP